MNAHSTNHWHEQIQRYLNGQSSIAEAVDFEAALSSDADLRTCISTT